MIGRPDPSEAAPYAFRYIDQVPGGDPVAVLRDQLEAWSTHLDDFRNVRKSTLSLIANLPESAWKRGGVASDHYVTVRALAFISAGHVAHHARILEERYLS